jgi:hypothetical protein
MTPEEWAILNVQNILTIICGSLARDRPNSSLAESGCWPPGYFDSKCPAALFFAGATQ